MTIRKEKNCISHQIYFLLHVFNAVSLAACLVVVVVAFFLYEPTDRRAYNNFQNENKNNNLTCEHNLNEEKSKHGHTWISFIHN